MSANSDKLVVKNRILSALPAEEYKRLLPNLKPVALEYKQVIYEPNKPIRYVYFPNDGVICLLSTVMGPASETLPSPRPVAFKRNSITENG